MAINGTTKPSTNGTATNGTKPFKVVIVGAGPSGLLLGLMLANKDIDVTIVDMGSELDTKPRATHYASTAVRELSRAGVLDDVRELGFTPSGTCWRKLDGTYLAGLKNAVVQDDPLRPVCLPLNKLGRVMYNHLMKRPTATVLWSHELIAMEQDENSARITCKTPDGEKTFEADYVVGCDGANSKVRRLLFGDWEFPGKTWAEQIVATNVYYPFEKYFDVDSNFIIHPEHWYMAARISKDGMWRVSYGELTGLSFEELIARQPMKYEIMLPGHPKPGDYKLDNISPYKIHQRCAEKFHVGRVLLVADAAHLCNPFGGLGLTGGIVDAGGCSDCLIGLAYGIADESILDKYDEIRRGMWNNIINVVSSLNIRRLNDQDPDMALENDEFLRGLALAEKDPSLMKSTVNVRMDIQHDFTQYYTKPLTAQTMT